MSFSSNVHNFLIYHIRKTIFNKVRIHFNVKLDLQDGIFPRQNVIFLIQNVIKNVIAHVQNVIILLKNVIITLQNVIIQLQG